MKKMLIAFFLTSLVFFTLVFSLGSLSSNRVEPFQVAMVTDFSDVNDGSFNQSCYEGAKEWSKKNNIKFNYFKPSDISKAERVKSMNLAIDRGYNVILCPGFALGEAIAEVAPKHPKVKFIGLDIGPGDFYGFKLTDNIVVYNYREYIGGYLAGYAAVKEGFTKLGYLGGIAAPAVVNFGCGYAQGISDAAGELGIKANLKYAYGGQFFGDSDIYKYMDNWYKTGATDIVFSCGGSIYTSVAQAAKENKRYMIGVDVDQRPIIDKDYGKGICVTSAMKDIKSTVVNKLEDLYKNKIWETGFKDLGIVSTENPDLNYVKLPTNDWRFKNFSISEYKKVVKEIDDGTREILVDADESYSLPKQESYPNVIIDGKKGTIK